MKLMKMEKIDEAYKQSLLPDENGVEYNHVKKYTFCRRKRKRCQGPPIVDNNTRKRVFSA